MRAAEGGEGRAWTPPPSALWAALLVLRRFYLKLAWWIAERIVDPWMVMWEEGYKALVHSLFATGHRWLETISALLLALFTGSGGERGAGGRATPGQVAAWRSWFARSRGTFNALLELEMGAGEGTCPPSPRQWWPVLSGSSKPPSRASSSDSLSAGWGQRSRGALRQRVSTGAARAAPPDPSSVASMLALPSGYLLGDAVRSNGLFSEAHAFAGRAVAWIFDRLRTFLIVIFFLRTGGDEEEETAEGEGDGSPARPLLSDSAASLHGPGAPKATRSLAQDSAVMLLPLLPLLRAGAVWEDAHVPTASDFILHAGYPLEEHSVTTEDGYVLLMHRIPAPDAVDAVLFQHGVLDTSLGWVANGLGSQAFAAADAGFDVWLANTRANAPRLNVKKERQGSRYWAYGGNELAMQDIRAQVEHVHRVKMAECETRCRRGGGGRAAEAQARRRGMARAVSVDAALHALHRGDQLERREEDEPAGVRTQSMQRAPSAQAVLTWDSDEVGGRVWEKEALSAGCFSSAQQPSSASSVQQPSSASCAQQPSSASSAQHPSSSASSAQHPSSSASSAQQPSSSASSAQHPSSSASSAQHPSSSAQLPYRLQAVGHSLGGACLLVYAAHSAALGLPHRLRRMVLMSPAGFHASVPPAVRLCKWVMPVAFRVLHRFLPGHGIGLRLPSPLLRFVAFKLGHDLRKAPALSQLLKAGIRRSLAGDESEWEAAMLMPHYSSLSMPALSLQMCAHFGQWAQDPRFAMFDYGSAAENQRAYGPGHDRPPSVAEEYRHLDIPVDFVAGTADAIVLPRDVQRHVQHMREGGVDVSYREFNVSHMDQTFAIRPELQEYVLSRLRKTTKEALGGVRDQGRGLSKDASV